MNHAVFVGGWRETVKVSINSTKSLFALDRGCKVALFMDYIYAKKRHYVVVVICYIKG